MKKLIFANCILAIAVIFSFCAKPDLKEELSTVTPEVSAGDRGNCVLTSVGTTTYTLRVCGTNTNATACQGCIPNVIPAPLTGVEFSGPGGTLNIPLVTPIVISITATNGPQSLYLNAGNNQLPQINLAQGQCRSFSIDDNCFITAL